MKFEQLAHNHVQCTAHYACWHAVLQEYKLDGQTTIALKERQFSNNL